MKKTSRIQTFLRSNIRQKNEKPTHTRIGNNSLEIHGGSYNIDYKDEKKFQQFKDAYYTSVIKRSKHEYLTEIQDRENGGPILVDLDFKFEKDVDERIFDNEIINDLVDTYADTIGTYFDLSNIDNYQVYVLQKESMNFDNSDYNKDGIHIQFPDLHMKHREQMFLRDKVMKKINAEIFQPSKIEFKNSLDDIFDKSISEGRTGWMVYGSRKPGDKPYKVFYKYVVTVSQYGGGETKSEEISENDSEDYEFDYELEEKDLNTEKQKDIFEKLLIRNNYDNIIELKPAYKNQLSSVKTGKKSNSKIVINKSISKSLIYDNFKNIKSKNDCDNFISLILENSTCNTEKIREINEYLVHCLDENYYEPYNEWSRVLWATREVSEMFYPFFLSWSSQSNKFDWDDEENLESILAMWKKGRDNGIILTEGSIRYWAKKNKPEKYDEIRSKCTDAFVHIVVKDEGTDHDLAKLIRHLLYDRFRCTSIKQNRWYEYKNHKWVTSESGTALRRKFSTLVSPLFLKKQRIIMNQIRDDDTISPEKQNKLTQDAAIYNKISLKLRDTAKKNNILTEAKELHYDSELENNLDENPNLLCFKNGVYDFTQKTFRDGIPEDYVSKCTNIDYIELDENNEKQKIIIEEIKDFIAKLFPNTNLRCYVWEYLASLLIGRNKNQTFNIFTGCGSNGKSVLVDLLSIALGDYKGEVPITLITEKRLGVGKTSSEVAQLKGKRFAVMQEPSKGDVINEGIMKEITGGDPIQARELYKPSFTFIPQFKLACCTNHLFSIKSNDEGTWRRIRVVDFESKFVDNPSSDPELNEFKKDKSLKDKFETWAPILMSMLIKIANNTNGNVTDCNEVLASSQKYREEQDYLAKFISEKIKKYIPNEDEENIKIPKISKNNISYEFKEWWKREFNTKVPKMQELYAYLEQKLGPYHKRGWHGYEIIYDDYDDED